MIPGEYFLEHEDVIANAGREVTRLLVRNAGDRPVQVGSHFHFFEVNAALELDREEARGKRLSVPRGPLCVLSRENRRRCSWCRSPERRKYGGTVV